MKKAILYILCMSCILLLFSGCSLVLAPNSDASAPSSKESDPSEQISTQQTQATQPAQTDASTPTEDSSAPTAHPVNDPYPQYVQTNINEIIESSDIYGRNTRPIPISIPKLLPFSDDAISCQEEIQNYFEPKLEEARWNASKGYGVVYAYIEHFVYLNNTILSVVIHERLMFDASVFHVYNFDIESGKQLDTETLVEKLQITDYTEKLTQAAKNFYETDNSELKDHTKYNERLEQTVSTENISKAVPYVAESGTVMAVVNIYALGGAEYYAYAIPIT